jgi:hypothetical protein
MSYVQGTNADWVPPGYQKLNKLVIGEPSSYFKVDENGCASTIPTATTDTQIPNNLQINNKLGLYVTPESFGAKGDAATDDAAAFNLAIAHCLATTPHPTLHLTKDYKLMSTVDMKDIEILGINSNIRIYHAGIGLIIGTTSGSISLGNVTRYVGTNTITTPTIRMVKCYASHVHIIGTQYLQLYADNSVDSTQRIPYNSFTFNTILDTLCITSTNDAGTPTGGWINENHFYLDRVYRILMDGGYGHNNNYFQMGVIEGSGTYITLNVGHHNYFTGARCESAPDTITFGSTTHDNYITTGYGGDPKILSNLPTITNTGYNNQYISFNDAKTHTVDLLNLSTTTPYISTFKTVGTGISAGAWQTNVEGLKIVQHLYNGSYFIPGGNGNIYETPLIPFHAGDYFALYSDCTTIRPACWVYDSTGALISGTDPAAISGFAHWSAPGQYDYANNVGDGVWRCKTGSTAAYWKLRIYYFNSGVTTTFKFMRLVLKTTIPTMHIPSYVSDLRSIVAKRLPCIKYTDDATTNMDLVGEGIPCYSVDGLARSINITKKICKVLATDGVSVLTLQPRLDYFNKSMYLAYNLATSPYTATRVAILDFSRPTSDAMTSTVTLASIPADITVGCGVAITETVTNQYADLKAAQSLNVQSTDSWLAEMPPGATWMARLSAGTLNADYVTIGSKTGSTSGNVTLSTAGARTETSSWIYWPATGNADSTTEIAGVFKITPSWSGTPSTSEYFMQIGSSATGAATGNIWLKQVTTTGTIGLGIGAQANTAGSVWNPVAGTEYIMEFYIKSGTQKVWIDGVQFLATTHALTFTAPTYIYVGRNAASVPFTIRDIVLFNGTAWHNAAHTSGYRLQSSGIQNSLTLAAATDAWAPKPLRVTSGATELFSVTNAGALYSAGVATLANATDASNSTAGGTIVSGGLAVAKKCYIGDTLAVTSSITINSLSVPTTVAVTGGTMSFTGPSNLTIPFNIVKVGRIVMLRMTNNTATSTNIEYGTCNAIIPPAYATVESVETLIQVTDGGNRSLGYIEVGPTDGSYNANVILAVLSISGSALSPAKFTNSGLWGLPKDINISWFV